MGHWGGGNAILTYGTTQATRASPYLCIGQCRQHGQHHTSLWGNTGNAIHLGQRRQHRQHHTSLWGNTGNTILMYGATCSTPYIWGNTGNTILMYWTTRATPYLHMGQCGQHHTVLLYGTIRRQHHNIYAWGNADNMHHNISMQQHRKHHACR